MFLFTAESIYFSAGEGQLGQGERQLPHEEDHPQLHGGARQVGHLVIVRVSLSVD